MISRVLNGRAASVIAYGARGSGKTYTIQVCFFISYCSLFLFSITSLN